MASMVIVVSSVLDGFIVRTNRQNHTDATVVGNDSFSSRPAVSCICPFVLHPTSLQVGLILTGLLLILLLPAASNALAQRPAAQIGRALACTTRQHGLLASLIDRRS